MKNKFLVTLFTAGAYFTSFAQWTPTTTSLSDAISRTGTVTLNPASGASAGVLKLSNSSLIWNNGTSDVVKINTAGITSTLPVKTSGYALIGTTTRDGTSALTVPSISYTNASGTYFNLSPESFSMTKEGVVSARTGITPGCITVANPATANVFIAYDINSSTNILMKNDGTITSLGTITGAKFAIGTSTPQSIVHFRNSDDGGDVHSGIRFDPASNLTTGATSYHRITGFRKSGLMLCGSANGSDYLYSNIILNDAGIHFGMSNGSIDPTSNIKFSVLNNGTTSLFGNLTVGSASSPQSPIFYVTNQDETGTNYGLSIITADKTLRIDGNDINCSGPLYLNDYSKQPTYIAGPVGIGVTNDSGYKLAVNGSVVATSMDILASVPNSDYVFDTTYQLKPLADVEAYIASHKHLPEVPSAAEFKAKGYNVGQMDDLLLRKVEELTLYMLELKKENQALKAQVDELAQQARK